MAMALSGRRRAAVVVVVLAAAALAGKVLYDSSDELFTAADTLTTVRVGWVLVAVLVELLSYLARGAATAVVLRRGGGRVGPLTLSAATLAGDAAAYCLPFGFAASGVVMLGVLRRRHVSTAVASWMFAVSSVFYVGTVSVLTIAAIPIAGDDDPIPGLQSITAVLLGVLVLAGAGYVLLRRPAIQRGLARVLPRLPPALRRRRALGSVSRPRSRRLLPTTPPWIHTAGSTLRAGLRDWTLQLRTVRLTPAAGLAVFALMMISWLADVAVLAIAFLALNATPPWTGLLLAYCAGQIAASVPVTPGGIGVVEGSITLALVAFGGDGTITLAAVLLYRLIAYWSCIPAGALTWLVLRVTSRAPADLVTDTSADQVATPVPEVEPAS
jgi:putative heme transporter